MLVLNHVVSRVTNLLPGYLLSVFEVSIFGRKLSSLLIIASVPANQIMKPTVVADEMFPEGAGPYMDLEEVPC